MIAELELEQDPRSNIKTAAGKYATSVDKVFAAGGEANVCTSVSQCHTDPRASYFLVLMFEIRQSE